ncbi:MAG: ABC transporter substrate-binding protein [Rhizobacter sp.]|nr:ABC transporter substrate-binding protein [Ferruginibacter sp.]
MILSSASTYTGSAKKIISLVPSQTELLYSLGLEEETLGITKFCLYPSKWFENKIRVGGTKTIDILRIIQLQPDLIIANKEENAREQVEELARHFPVWITEVNTLKDAFQMITDIGTLTGTSSKANLLSSEIKLKFAQPPFSTKPIPVTYLIWKDPYMTIGGDTFINDMLNKAGFRNLFAGQLRYPEITIDDIKNSGCNILLLSSEPFPFKEKHIDVLQDQLPGSIIKLVDGELFSWYGSRLLHSPAYFLKLRKELVGGS